MCCGLTVLRARSEQVDNVFVFPDHLHHLHLWHQVWQIFICGVIWEKQKRMKPDQNDETLLLWWTARRNKDISLNIWETWDQTNLRSYYVYKVGERMSKQREKDTMLLISFRKSQSTVPSLSLSRSCINSWSAATTITHLSAFSQQQWAACWASPCRCRRPRPSPPDRSSPRPEVYPELAWNKSKNISELGFLPQAVFRGVF